MCAVVGGESYCMSKYVCVKRLLCVVRALIGCGKGGLLLCVVKEGALTECGKGEDSYSVYGGGSYSVW